jgi:hypothetical protein
MHFKPKNTEQSGKDQKRSPKFRKPRKVIPLLLGILFLFQLCACATTEKQQSKEEIRERTLSVEERWGIDSLHIRLTAADFMLDFQYRVLDPPKAAPLLDRHIKPYLIDQESGKKLWVPTETKLGSLRSTTNSPTANQVYRALFSNPNKLVKRGSKVTIVIGESKVEDLVVE